MTLEKWNPSIQKNGKKKRKEERKTKKKNEKVLT